MDYPNSAQKEYVDQCFSAVPIFDSVLYKKQ